MQLRIAARDSPATGQVRVCFQQRDQLEEQEGVLEESATIVNVYCWSHREDAVLVATYRSDTDVNARAWTSMGYIV